MQSYIFNDEKDLITKRFKEFETKVYQNEKFILFVFAEWCGHCKHMKPIVDQVLQELKRRNCPITFVSVSDVVFSNLEKSPNGVGPLLKKVVVGFPTMCLVEPLNSQNKLNVTMYSSPHEKDPIEKFLLKAMPVKPIAQSKTKSAVASTKPLSRTKSPTAKPAKTTKSKTIPTKSKPGTKTIQNKKMSTTTSKTSKKSTKSTSS